MGTPNWIELQGTVNVRDVGGLPVGDGSSVLRSGVLIRAAHLQYLTDDDVARLVTDLGVRRIVDLRSDVEVERMGAGPMYSAPGVTIHNYSLYPAGSPRPQEDSAVRVADAPRPEASDTPAAAGEEAAGRTDHPIMPWHNEFSSGRDPVVQAYLRYLVRRPDSIVASLRAVAAPDGATVVHCAAGKDRTGVVVALALAVVGVARDVITADYQATEQQLEAIVEHLAVSGLYNREIAGVNSIPHPDATIMRDVLEAIDEDYGGVIAYLAQHGWTDADTAALRAKLVS